MPIDDQLQAAGNMVKCGLPVDTLESLILSADNRMQQSRVETECLAECCAFLTKSPEIRGVVRVARDHRAVAVIGCDEQPAAHPAIGAGGANRQWAM